MNSTHATALIVAALAALLVMWVRTRRALRVTREQLQQTTATLAHARAELERAAWQEWWAKNAAEMTPVDDSRPAHLHFAFALALAPSLREFADDMERVAADALRSDEERRVAAMFVLELCEPELPWVRYARETDRPFHTREAVRRAYREELQCIPWERRPPALQQPQA